MTYTAKPVILKTDEACFRPCGNTLFPLPAYGFDVAATAVFVGDIRLRILMSFELDTTIGSDVVIIGARGQHSLQNVYEVLEQLRRLVNESGLKKAILDGRSITGVISEAERFLIGQRIAEIFGPSVRIVILMVAENITKLGELAARNRGAMLLVTDSDAEATHYLASN